MPPLFLRSLWTVKIINDKKWQMLPKAQNIFNSRDPLVDEPQKTDMTEFQFG